MLYENFQIPNFNLSCTDVVAADCVDLPIRESMHFAITNTYFAESWISRMNESFISDRLLPYNLAYRACFQWDVASDVAHFTGHNLNSLIEHVKGKSVRNVDEETALNTARQPWYGTPDNQILNESALDLFQMAVKAISAAIYAGENYISESSDFACCGVPFLEKDHNIDTGLPSELNPDIFVYSSYENRFSVATNILRNNYDWAASLQ